MEKRDVADDDAESDRDEKERLPLVFDGKEYEQDADADHQKILIIAVGKPRILPELLKIADDVSHSVELFDGCEDRSFKNGIAFRNFKGDCAVYNGFNVVFHLHRFKDHQALSFLDRVTVLALEVEYDARQR